MHHYADRKDAGQSLAKELQGYKNKQDCLVLGLARGGIPVAYEIAAALSLPLDVFIVRKLGVPGFEELAMGAIASGNTVVFNEDILNSIRISEAVIEQVIEQEQQELNRREKLYRGTRSISNFNNKTIILVDDGIATGATMRAAITALQHQQLASLIVAVPVAAFSTCNELTPLVSHFVCPLRPVNFQAVGLWYDNFPQTEDEEVIELLNEGNKNILRS